MCRMIFGVIAFLFSNCACGQYMVKFEVRQPAANHSSDKIFIAGSFNNWNPSLTENSFSIDESGAGHYEMQLPAGSYQYKFTRGAWDKTECLQNGAAVANRALLVTKDTSIYITIAAWSDDFAAGVIVRKHTASPNVRIIDSAFAMPQLNRQRRIWIYLPANYEMRKKRYPVIYMHDGQNLFDEATSGFGEWGIDEYLDSLFKKSKRESIIVGIDNGSKRLNEYNPYYFSRAGNGEGKQYVDFLVKTLKPYIDKHFNTLPGKDNTFIAGSSMGGLISLFAVLKYPNVFGGAGIFSPAFWTAGGIDKDVKDLSSKVNSKLFFYAGAKESEEMIPDMQKIEKEIKGVSKSTLKENIDADATHNEVAWRRHFPEFYQWIFGIK